VSIFPRTLSLEEDPSLLSRVQAASDWYEQWTGVPVTTSSMSRVLQILLYAEREGVGLGECALNISPDPKWPQRSVRTPNQARAVSIGKTQVRGQSAQHVYIYRRDP